MTDNNDDPRDVCAECDEEITVFGPDSKCCDQIVCKDCLEFSNSCDNCSAELCQQCDELECQKCQEEDQCTDVCKKCIAECFYCRRDFCHRHLIMGLAQMAPCKACAKQPCLDKTHPKERYDYVLRCFECNSEATEKARKRKQFFASASSKINRLKK